MPAPDDGGAEGGAAPTELGSFIREQRRLAHLSMRKLAEAAGVSNPYLSQIERGLRRPSAEILQQIARGLAVSAESLYERAGILEPRQGDVDVVGEISRDTGLSRDQRDALIRIYRSFRAESSGVSGSSAAGAPVLDPDRTDQESSDDAQR